MQQEPEKVLVNYNEFHGVPPRTALSEGGLFRILRAAEQRPTEPEEVIRTGVELVNDKIDEILGVGNKLTRGDLGFPEVRFIPTLPEYPNYAGYYSPFSNEIGIVLDKTQDTLSRTKVFVHECFHFLSHNGRDDGEQLDQSSPIARHNNVGFSRGFGLDIRAGKEGEQTRDYFLAFNEAVTEQLAIDLIPGVHETYGDYRGLLNQVLDDAVTRKLGSKDESGAFLPWSREEFKDYVYECFFKGDLEGFTRLLKNIYREYDISEQQFGLMTHKDDLPSVIEAGWADNNPDSPPPSPRQVAAAVQLRLDSKGPADYVTDVIGPEPDGGNTENAVAAENKYGAEYDAFIKENGISHSSKETVEGLDYELDNLGYIIYRDQTASSILGIVREEFDGLVVKYNAGEITLADITGEIDKLLFEVYVVSMLSDGFRDFYIYKHARIDNL